MYDWNNLPCKVRKVQVFIGKNDTVSPVTWVKPKNARIVSMLCVSSGSGGSNSTGTGSGGGGSGAVASCVLPAIFVPDVLYILAGGPSATGTAGRNSFIAADPTLSTIFLRACNAVATATTTTAAGAGATVSTNALSPLACLGVYTFTAGVNGAAGAAGAVGTSITPGSSLFLSGGASQGGNSGATARAGGDISANGVYVGSPGGTADNKSVNGCNGHQFVNSSSIGMPLFTGGVGAGVAAASAANRGADGGLGCGGGGAHTTGGSGGAGFVIISCV